MKLQKARDVEEEIISFTSCAWTYLWDNFNKTHGSNSVVYGDQHTSTLEVINHAVLALPPPKPCPSERCRAQCIDSCYWQKENPANKKYFNEIYLNQQETTAKNDFIETRSKYFLNETSKIFTQLTNILNDSNLDGSRVNSLPPTSLDTDTIDENTFLRAELNIALESTKNILKTRDVIRKLFDVKNFSNSGRIILPSVGGRDTDPNVTYEILQYGSRLFLKDTENSDRVFVTGDQKTMGLAMRLKKQYGNFDHYCVTIPDLHFRKSLMHAIVRQYEHLV